MLIHVKVLASSFQTVNAWHLLAMMMLMMMMTDKLLEARFLVKAFGTHWWTAFQNGVSIFSPISRNQSVFEWKKPEQSLYEHLSEMLEGLSR